MLTNEMKERITEGLFKKPAEDASWNCSEYVTITLGSLLKIPQHHLDILQKTSTALGFGMGDGAGPCGILSAMVLLLGYQKGRLDAEDTTSKQICYDLGKELKERIIAQRHEVPEELTNAGGFWSLPDGNMACRSIRIPEEGSPEGIPPQLYCRIFLKMALNSFHQIGEKIS